MPRPCVRFSNSPTLPSQNGLLLKTCPPQEGSDWLGSARNQPPLTPEGVGPHSHSKLSVFEEKPLFTQVPSLPPPSEVQAFVDQIKAQMKLPKTVHHKELNSHTPDNHMFACCRALLHGAGLCRCAHNHHHR
eukprot:EG_transcript_17870